MWNDDERRIDSSIKYYKTNIENNGSLFTNLKQIYDDEKQKMFVYNNTNFIHKSIKKIYYPKPLNLPSLKYEKSLIKNDELISINHINQINQIGLKKIADFKSPEEEEEDSSKPEEEDLSKLEEEDLSKLEEEEDLSKPEEEDYYSESEDYDNYDNTQSFYDDSMIYKNIYYV